MMRFYLLTLIAVLLLSGCVPHSDAPLTDAGQQAIDRSILGTWSWRNKDESGFVHIGLDAKLASLRIVMLDIDKNGELEMSEFTGHTSSLAGNSYLNLKWIRPAQTSSGHIIVKYLLKDGALGIAIMDNRQIERAIEAGSIAGTLKEPLSVHITADQEALRKYILANDLALFPETKFLARPVLPETGQ